MFDTLNAWLVQSEAFLVSLGIVSIFLFVFSLLTLPWLITLLPSDYFQRPIHHESWGMLRKPSNVIRNVLGLFIVLSGILMLILPGQGLLTIFLGVAIMNFPGKYALERRIISHRGVLQTVNWMRQKAGKETLKVN